MSVAPALFYDTGTAFVTCTLCPHNCSLTGGKTGICGVRREDNGVIIPLSYSELTCGSLDPIEKKPLYHFYPGEQIFSIGSWGCNLKCPFCQNSNISSFRPVNAKKVNPEEIINRAISSGSQMIAYTYSEPVVWYETVLECAILAASAGLKNVMVSNGYISAEPLEKLSPYIDAWNIDLKCFSEKKYRNILGGSLEPVKESIIFLNTKSHIEITTLAVTGFNDDIFEMDSLADFIASVSKKIPWHISRYFPAYKYNSPPTDENFILDVRKRNLKKLDYVYCGNMNDEESQNTYCPSCSGLLIERSFHGNYQTIISDNYNAETCLKCGEKINIRS